jgi:hypothetical protein
MVACHRCSGSFSALHRVSDVDMCRPAVDLDEAWKSLNMAIPSVVTWQSWLRRGGQLRSEARSRKQGLSDASSCR